MDRRRRLLKTILYRLSATIIVQIVSWILCRQLAINVIVGITDIASTVWYYIYEGFWNE